MYLQYISCFRRTCVSTVYRMLQEDPCIYSILCISGGPVYLQYIIFQDFCIYCMLSEPRGFVYLLYVVCSRKICVPPVHCMFHVTCSIFHCMFPIYTKLSVPGRPVYLLCIICSTFHVPLYVPYLSQVVCSGKNRVSTVHYMFRVPLYVPLPRVACCRWTAFTHTSRSWS